MSDHIDGRFDGRDIEESIQKINVAGTLGARADFRPELFDTAIFQKGYRILWEQSMLCSCYTKNSGQPDYNCPVCKGKGYVYFDPKEIRAVVSSINGHKEQTHLGLFDLGSAYLTSMSTDDIGFRDRFTFLDFTTKFSEVIIHDENMEGSDIDTFRYPAKEMVSVRKLDTTYIQGRDYDVSKDGRSITWKTYMNPGDQYSVLYKTNPVYIAIGPIHELRGTYSVAKAKGLEIFYQFPKQYQIKREDFLDEQQIS